MTKNHVGALPDSHTKGLAPGTVPGTVWTAGGMLHHHSDWTVAMLCELLKILMVTLLTPLVILSQS